MSDSEPTLDFSSVLASSVHDMKNSLTLLMLSLDDIASDLTKQGHESKDRLSQIQYEAARVNNDLVQLLSLYKLDRKLLAANIDEHSLFDFLDTEIARFEPLFQSQDIACDIDCPDDLYGYFDRELVTGVLGNVLANTIRYAETKIRVSAEETENGGFLICVEDDGPGFPDNMLNWQEDSQSRSDFLTGSTNLGLYFARQIARLHHQGDQQGRIELKNGGTLGGGIFRLQLP